MRGVVCNAHLQVLCCVSPTCVVIPLVSFDAVAFLIIGEEVTGGGGTSTHTHIHIYAHTHIYLLYAHTLVLVHTCRVAAVAATTVVMMVLVVGNAAFLLWLLLLLLLPHLCHTHT